MLHSTKLMCLCLLGMCVSYVKAGNVLALSALFTGSHDFVLDHIAQKLVTAGHNVVYYRVRDVIVPHKTSQYYQIHNVHANYSKSPHPFVTEDNLSSPAFDLYWNSSFNLEFLTRGFLTISKPQCSVFLGDVNLMNNLKKGSYDVMLLDVITTECNLAIAKQLNIPVVVYTALPLLQEPFRAMGLHFNPALSPIPTSKMASLQTFYDRMVNTYIYYMYEATFQVYSYFTKREIQKYMPELNSLNELYKMVEVVLCNPHPIVMPPLATTEKIKYLGCVTCKPAKPLPKNINRFIDNKNGSIMLSFGFSGFKSEFVPTHIVQSLREAFKQLDQNVIIRFDKTYFDGIPNVLAVDWLQQMDILGHRRLKLMISNCGINTAMEIIYHEVPVLCIPLGADQDDNAVRLQTLGVGEILSKWDISSRTVYEVVRNMLEPPNYNRYKQQLAKYGYIIRNPETKPLDKALYWIELVMREKKLGYTDEPILPMIQFHSVDFFLVNLLLIGLIMYGCSKFYTFVAVQLVFKKKLD